MIDRKKVISQVEEEVRLGKHWDESDRTIDMELLENVLLLLKEQEVKEVKKSTNMYTGLPITHCPKCGISLDRYLYGRQYAGQINYCPMCGQAVKWI